jgi:hypothetical protein
VIPTPRLRPLHYLWASPTTLLGLALAGLALAGRGRAARVGGVLEAHGGLAVPLLERLMPGGGAVAIALGHVIVARDAASLEQHRAHERVHVRQAERWGPLFVPAYLAAGLWAWLRGGHPYRDNRFEREAERAVLAVTRDSRSDAGRDAG